MKIIILLIILGIIYELFKRYFPVVGVRYTSLKDIEGNSIQVLDIRDYNESYTEAVKGAINIPVAYLKRGYHDIPNKNVHLVTSSLIEKNLGIRILRRKGFRIVGYTVVDHKRMVLNEKLLEGRC